MRKYSKPTIEKVEFCYEEQVVASGCVPIWNFTGGAGCPQDEQQQIGQTSQL